MTTQRTAIDWEAVRRRLQAGERALEATLSPDDRAVREVLTARAKSLAQRRVDRGELKHVRRYLLLRARSNAFALDLERVAEVGQLERCTPVPGGPAHLVGVFSHRGDVHSILDLGVLLGAELPESVRLGSFVHIRPPNGGRPDTGAWLRVDELDRVLEIKPGEIAPADASAATSLNVEPGAFSRYIDGVTRDGVFVLRADALREQATLPGSSDFSRYEESTETCSVNIGLSASGTPGAHIYEDHL